MSRPWSVWIGFDSRETATAAFAVARESIRRRRTAPFPIYGVVLDTLVADGLYTRPTERRLGRLYDVLSHRADYDGAMSTEFALSRFLVPHLARANCSTEAGLALFLDCDMLVRTDLTELFRQCEGYENRGKAVYCVKHDHRPAETEKMDGQAQACYPRKNWTSFMVFDCDHPANRLLTLKYVNAAPGRDLHALSWLADCDIGALDPAWNWLAGYSDPAICPKVVHHTSGSPALTAFRDAPYADEWRAELARWAA